MARHPAIVERVFTAAEREYCLSKADPVQHFAARFAAKEAVGKALGTGVLGWREIEIISGGQPVARVTGAMRRAADRAGVAGLSVSLSHSGSVSAAVAIAVIND